MVKAAQTKTKEQRLKDLVFEMFTEEEVQLDLLCPLNLVRVIPKENTSRGGIVLPDAHNKLLYEGIVLKVWTGRRREGYTETPLFAVGDHVVFQHFVGIPCFDLLDKDKYRMIGDNDIQATLRYERVSVADLLKKEFAEFGYVAADDAIDALCTKFDIVPKGQKPLTESGK